MTIFSLRLDRTFWYKLLVAPTSHGGVQFIRYGLVAGIAFIVDFGLLYVFTSHLHWFYLLSATSSFAISVVVNYLLSTAWVFAKRNKRQRTLEITIFIAICTVALGLNDMFMWLFTSVIGMHYLYSKLITVAIVFFWSFGARRIFFHSDFFTKRFFSRFNQDQIQK
ncbi:MAG TPA: GtrA family protein [Candidatus Saccharimonadales bacterium]